MADIKPMVSIGEKAPEFTLPGTGGTNVSLANFRDKILVLYFYPRDATPGCTKQAVAFSEMIEQFSKLNAQVVGVSADSLESHEKFAKKQDLKFPLASDVETTTLDQYGVWVAKKMYGRSFMGIERTTFLIENGIVRQIWRKVRVPGHVEEVLEAVGSIARK